jgi:uncharacterized protein (TIGR00255 family)
MTGYGKTTCELLNKKVTIELKSLNSKQLDLSVRVPVLYKEKEMSLRNEISKTLERGKIDFLIYSETTSSSTSTSINNNAVASYYKQIKDINDKLGIETSSDIISSILRLPDSLETEREELDKSEWDTVYKHIQLTFKELNNFREQEGEALEKDIIERIENIKILLSKVDKFEKERIPVIRKRILESLSDINNVNGIDENRFEQELIYYLEKLDITEEKVRLLNHCDYFLEIVADKNSSGKKLGFIGQEIGREINTLGSKANNKDIQHIVIQMKDELEKIKEQLLNVL